MEKKIDAFAMHCILSSKGKLGIVDFPNVCLFKGILFSKGHYISPLKLPYYKIREPRITLRKTHSKDSCQRDDARWP